MKFALLVSIGLFVASSYAAESSTPISESCVKTITLMSDDRTFNSKVNLLRMGPTKKSMVEHVKLDLPCVWALIHCESLTKSTGIRRKLRNFDEIHTKVAAYNEKHTKHPIVRDPHYYLVWQDANGALKGRLLGREEDALSNEPGYSDLSCMLTEPKLPVRALATLRQYMEGNLYNEAVDWYRTILKCSNIGQDLVAMDDPQMEWCSTLHRVSDLCFVNGEFQKSHDMAQQALRFKHNELMKRDMLSLLCLVHSALHQWQELIDCQWELNPHCDWPDDSDKGLLKVLAEAYERKGLLEKAFYTSAKVLNQMPQIRPEFSTALINVEYASACMHFMYYYAIQNDVLKQLSPKLKHQLGIAAGVVNEISERMANVNESSEESPREFEQGIRAFKALYPGRYEIALRKANHLLGELALETNKQGQDPREFAIAAPEPANLPTPAA